MTRFEERPADWLAPGEALGRILAHAPSPTAEEVSLPDAVGRALVEAITAAATLPPWDNSAMDGYAVRGEDVAGATAGHPVVLRVVGAAPAGTRGGDLRAGQGEAVRIMTGGPLPAGADSVVRVEDTDREAAEAGRVVILSDRDQGRNVRPRGEDVREGETLLDAGDTLGAGQIGLLAAAGRATVLVGARPRVAVLCSGDELLDPGDVAGARSGAGVPNSNGPALEAALALCGAEPLSLGVARDREDDVREHLERALEADVLVTVGGASMGEADLFKRVLDTLGFQLDFWRVRMRPGTPLGFGHLPRAGAPPLPVFGLPGNPASAFVTFHLMVRPFVLKVAGHARVHLPSLAAVAGEPMAGGGRSARVWRVRLEEQNGTRVVRLAGRQGSGLVRSLGVADGLVVVPAGEAMDEGSPVRALLLERGVPAGGTDPFGGGREGA